MTSFDTLIYNGLFWLLALTVIFSAGVVAFSGRLVRAGFALLFTFAGVAGLYLFMGADFLGIAQIAIYVGGILVLILFGVMFTAGADERLANVQNTLQGPAGTFVVFAVALPLLFGTVILSVWPVQETGHGNDPTIAGIGELLLTKYLLPFEIASLLLLVALVGAVVLARGERRERMEGTGASDG